MEVGEKLFNRAYSNKNAYHSSVNPDVIGINVFLQFAADSKRRPPLSILNIVNIVNKIYNDTRRGTIIALYNDNTTKIIVISSISPQTQTKIKHQIETQCKKA